MEEETVLALGELPDPAASSKFCHIGAFIKRRAFGILRLKTIFGGHL